ncbi:transmembrane channel-related [Holotrichia oblita]|uniref:Transmembrane channel-related n=1 Tax=Holotrichia oblita TaxID=644536 RepID=A0ACB9SP26_HOLOL|nr:transmembrane channel-related [Holotrichia oblita]
MTSVSGSNKTLGCGKMLKYQIGIWFSRIQSNIRNLSYSYELWYSSLKEIEGNFGSGVSSYFKFLRRLFILNLLMTVLGLSFIVAPQVIFSVNTAGENVTVVNNNVNFSAEDLFTGAGYLTNTLMYYGFYTTGRINGVYSMPDAYFYTMVCIFIGNAVIIGVNMAKSYRKSFIETMGGLQNVFAHKIFCGWDYSIAKEQASSLKSNAIYTELKELLSDRLKMRVKRNFIQKFIIRTLQLAGHLFVFALVGAIGYLMWILLERHRVDDEDKDISSTVPILTAVIINVIVLVFPLIFRLIGSYEGYKSPRVRVIVTFLRTLLLEIVIVGILTVFWLTHSENQACWENSLGQEIYRLILFDFFFSVIFLSLFEGARYLLHKKFKSIKAPEFDISGNTFSVIYNQTLFWLGFYYSPMLGVVIILKLFLTWYVRSWVLLGFCVPPNKSWRAAQTETLFLIITFLSSLLLLLVHGYTMLMIRTSETCGPFRYVEFMHQIFFNAIADMDGNNTALIILSFISKPGVIALILIGLTMLVYYLRSKSVAQRNFVMFLRRRLVLAAQDKEFLLRHISEVSNGGRLIVKG